MALSNKTEKKNKKLFWILTLALFILLSLLGYVGYLYLTSDKISRVTTVAPKDTKKLQTNGDIFFAREERTKKNKYGNGTVNLYSVNSITKKITLHVKNISPELKMSPNKELVAYIKGGDVWLIRSDGNGQRKVVSLALDGANGVESQVLSWLPGSDGFIYNVAFLGCMGCKGPTKTERTMLGTYLYSLSSKHSTKLAIKLGIEQSASVKVARSNELLFSSEISENEPKGQLLNAYNLVTGKTRVLWRMTSEVSQLDLSKDGSHIIYVNLKWETPDGDEEGGPLVLADINNNTQKVLQEGKWGELQAPSFLPGSNTKYIYEWQREDKCKNKEKCDSQSGLYLGEVGREPKFVTKFTRFVSWHDQSSALVVISEPENSKETLLLVDVESGKASNLVTVNGETQFFSF